MEADWGQEPLVQRVKYPRHSAEKREESTKDLFGERERRQPSVKSTVQLGSAGGFRPNACPVRRSPAEEKVGNGGWKDDQAF